MYAAAYSGTYYCIRTGADETALAHATIFMQADGRSACVYPEIKEKEKQITVADARPHVRQ